MINLSVSNLVEIVDTDEAQIYLEFYNNKYIRLSNETPTIEPGLEGPSYLPYVKGTQWLIKFFNQTVTVSTTGSYWNNANAPTITSSGTNGIMVITFLGYTGNDAYFDISGNFTQS